MTLTQLRYLIAIADSGLNITLAAERVHATQPGLSKQLKQLEDELGFLLFSRKGRSLDAVTPAGAEVITHARALLAGADNIRAYAANQRRESHGELLLATTHTQARFVLPAAIAQMKLAYPQVGVHLRHVDEAEVLEQLARGLADLAVISTAGQIPHGGIAVPLFGWRRVVLVPRGHALDRHASEEPLHAPTMQQLAAHPLVSYDSSQQPESSLRRAFDAAGLELRLAMTARDADLIKTYVRAGLGVGLLAEMAVTSEDADLRVLRAPDAIPACTTWAVLPRERVLRDYTLDLVLRLAPQIDHRDLRRALAGTLDPQWPSPPSWSELSQSITQ